MLSDILSAQLYVDTVAANYKKYLGAFSGEDPSTPLFQIRQISEFLKSNTVLCGVYDSTSGSFGLTFNNYNQTFDISQGTIRYNGIDYIIANSSLNYAPLFNAHNSSDFYIATIYADVKTLKNNKIVNFTLSQPLSPGSSSIYVREISDLIDIKIPFKVQIGNSLYQAGTTDSYAGRITLSSSSGGISGSLLAGSKIYAIQEPTLGCVYTHPFSDSGNVFLSNHINKTILPTYALRLYDILMTNPSSPSVVTTGGVQQIKTCFINFYGQTYDEDKARNLSDSIDAFRASLIQSQTSLDIDLAISNFNAATQQYTLTGDVSSFWLNTPLLQPEVISAGVDLGRYKKFDFPDKYLEANYAFNSSNLYELLYAFDPYNYSNVNIYSASGSISGLTVRVLDNYGPPVSGLPSTVIYSATATAQTSYPSGETPAVYSGLSNISTNSNNAAIEILFSPLNATTFAFYTVYRKSIYSNLSVDLPLTSPQEISGDVNFGALLPAAPISGSQNYSGFTGAYTILNTNGYLSKFAYEFRPRLPGGSTEDKVYIGGVAAYMSVPQVYTGNAAIQMSLMSANPTLLSGSVLGTSDYMFANRLTTTPTEYSFKFNEYVSGSLNVNPNQYYYIVSTLQNPDLNNNISIYGHTTTATGSTIAQGFTGSWGYVPQLAFNFRTLGFVDNLSNSGSSINKTLPLSNYVFKGLRQIRNKLTSPKSIYAYVPYFKVDANGQKVITYTSNDMIVRIMGANSSTGNVYDSGYVVVPSGTPSGQKILLTESNLIDKITYISVEPGLSADVDSSGQVIWGTYDYLLIIGDE